MASTRYEFTELHKKALLVAAAKTGILLPTMMIIVRGFQYQVEA